MLQRAMALLAAALAMTACTVVEPNSHPGWLSVSEQTTCQAVAPGACIGEYGFTIEATGRFVAGPSPAGLHVEGRLPESEQRNLQTAVQAALRHPRKDERCVDSHNIPGISDRITLALAGGVSRAVFRRESPSQLCFSGDQSAVKHLHEVMQRLMAEHYPQRFPE